MKKILPFIFIIAGVCSACEENEPAIIDVYGVISAFSNYYKKNHIAEDSLDVQLMMVDDAGNNSFSQSKLKKMDKSSLHYHPDVVVSMGDTIFSILNLRHFLRYNPPFHEYYVTTNSSYNFLIMICNPNTCEVYRFSSLQTDDDFCLYERDIMIQNETNFNSSLRKRITSGSALFSPDPEKAKLQLNILYGKSKKISCDSLNFQNYDCGFYPSSGRPNAEFKHQ